MFKKDVGLSIINSGVINLRNYLDIVENILSNSRFKEDRTNHGTYSIVGVMFKHDMKTGFPLLTTKKMPFGCIAKELEFFIRGITDKRWLQERDVHIWDYWANPQKVPYSSSDPELQKKMFEEPDLGAIYGFQWRHFGAQYDGPDKDYSGKGIDQFAKLIETIKRDPNNRRMIVSAWNPCDMNKMGLPPCHYGFQVIVLDNKVDLLWNQRSVDTILGLPFNIASYALLLHLIAKETHLQEGELTGFLGDTHIYKNHMELAREQVRREPLELGQIVTEKFTNIFDWTAKDSKVVGYKSHPKMDYGKPAV